MNYPHYETKVHTKNVGEIRHLHEHSLLSTLKWETKLRFYGKEAKNIVERIKLGHEMGKIPVGRIAQRGAKKDNAAREEGL